MGSSLNPVRSPILFGLLARLFDLLVIQNLIFAGGKGGGAEIADADALEALHVATDFREHAPDLAIDSLGENDAKTATSIESD